MSQKPNCKQITSALKAIRSKRIEFDAALKENRIEVSVKLMGEINSLIKEIVDQIWPLEILTKENIEKQYNEWQEVYKDLEPKYQLPSKERVFEFLKNDPDFMELMKTKEKQGLTKLIIAPSSGSYSLKDLAENIGQKIKECGGADSNYYSDTWQKMFENEDNIHYFGTIDNTDPTNPKPTGGVTTKEIKANPDKYSVCDGWMISFTTDEQNITKDSESEKNTGGGRVAIKTNMQALQYQETYFSDKNETYKGEESMIPQEHFALFVKDLFEKYVKTNKTITTKSNDLLDSSGVTWFVSTYLPGYAYLPSARWDPDDREFRCSGDRPTISDDNLGVRSAVRSKLK